MNIKQYSFWVLMTLAVMLGCKQQTDLDVTGTYIGHIQGKGITMYLEQSEQNKVTGKIIDRNTNYLIDGKMDGDKLICKAIDTLQKVEFDVEGTWNLDTLTFMMSMLKPQKTPKPFPLKFIKVFISTNEAGKQELADLNLFDTSGNKPVNNPQKIAQNKAPDLSMMGFWEVNQATGKAKMVINGNKYFLFNADKSISKLDKTLIPLEGYSWAATPDSVAIYYKVDGKIGEEILGIESFKNQTLTLKNNQSYMVMKKHVQ